MAKHLLRLHRLWKRMGVPGMERDADLATLIQPVQVVSDASAYAPSFLPPMAAFHSAKAASTPNFAAIEIKTGSRGASLTCNYLMVPTAGLHVAVASTPFTLANVDVVTVFQLNPDWSAELTARVGHIAAVPSPRAWNGYTASFPSEFDFYLPPESYGLFIASSSNSANNANFLAEEVEPAPPGLT